MGVSHRVVFAILLLIVALVIFLRAHKKRITDISLLFIYIGSVLFITIGIRGSGLNKEPLLNPFYKYGLVLYRIGDSASTEGLAGVWQTIKTNEVIISELVLNILLFVPLGIFLPRVSKLFCKWWSVMLAGFAISFLIEMIQMSCQRGCFESVDIMNNTIGALIGYLLFCKFLREKEVVDL